MRMQRMSCSAGGASSATLLSGPWRQSIAAIVTFLAALLLCSSPAHALSQRGHSFGGSFGEAFGEGGKDKLSKPSAIAVNEASTGEAAGDVYVLDSANNRVVRFEAGPEHK